MPGDDSTQVRIKVVGVGGAGGNAIARMAASGLHGVEILAVNTDVQALGRLTRIPTFAIGPNTTAGMGSGGDPDIGRRAMKESQGQVAQLLEGLDLLFIAAGLGGGTGTGAAPILADDRGRGKPAILFRGAAPPGHRLQRPGPAHTEGRHDHCGRQRPAVAANGCHGIPGESVQAGRRGAAPGRPGHI